jgi:hypothetical protein
MSCGIPIDGSVARSVITIGFVNISKAANELDDNELSRLQNLDRLQIYMGGVKSLVTSCG